MDQKPMIQLFLCANTNEIGHKSGCIFFAAGFMTAQQLYSLPIVCYLSGSGGSHAGRQTSDDIAGSEKEPCGSFLLMQDFICFVQSTGNDSIHIIILVLTKPAAKDNVVFLMGKFTILLIQLGVAFIIDRIIRFITRLPF